MKRTIDRSLLQDVGFSLMHDDDKSADSEETYEERFKKEEIRRFFILLTHKVEWQLCIVLTVLMTYTAQTAVVAFFIVSYPYRIFRGIMDLFYLADIGFALLNKFASNEYLRRDYPPRKLFLLFLDTFTLLSVDYLINFGTEKEKRLHPAYIIMQIILLCRTYRFFYFVVKITHTAGYGTMVVLLGKYIVLTGFIIHTLTCGWAYVNGFEEKGLWTSLLKDKWIIIDESWDRYLSSMYFVVPLFTSLGFGDLYPIRDEERKMSILYMMIGFIFLLGIFLGALTTYCVEYYRHQFYFSSRLELIHQDLVGHRPVPKEVHERVLDYYQNFWKHKQGVLYSEIFDKLPKTMRREVFVEQYWDAFQTSALLCDLDFAVKRALATTMETRIYIKGDIIIKQGELRTCMMYIVRGFVKILSSEDTESTVMLLTEGSLLSEASLVLSTPSPVQIEAGTLCEIQILDKVNLFTVAITYQQITGFIHQRFTGKFDDIAHEHKKVEQEIMLSTSIHGQDNFRCPLGQVKHEICMLDEQRRAGRPYTWWREDEMDHLLKKSKQVQNAMSVYVPCKLTTVNSDDLCAHTKFPFVLHPGTSLILLWDLIIFLVICATAFAFPYKAAFQSYKEESTTERIAFMMIDILYLIDTCISFFTALDTKGQRLVGVKDIAIYRVTHISCLIPLIIDILAVLPLQFLYEQGKNEHAKRLFLLIRLLKTWKLQRFFHQIENNFILNLALVRVVMYVLWLFIVAYWIGAFYYLQACFKGTCRDVSWYTNLMVHEIDQYQFFDRFRHKVTTSLYFGMVIITGTGFGDITASTAPEMIIIIALCIFSIMMFSYFVCSYSAILILFGRSRNDFAEFVTIIKLFMHNNNLLSSIRIRMVCYLKLQWQYMQGYYIINNKTLYFDAPEHIFKEVRVAKRHNVLIHVPLFEHADPNLISFLAHCANSYVLPPYEVVIYSGEPCRGFYIIQDGYCEAFSGISGELERVLGPRSNFCVIEMLFGLSTVSSIRTVTHVKLLHVTLQQLQNALAHFPLVRNEITVLVKEIQSSNDLQKVLTRQKIAFYDDLSGLKIQRSWIVHDKKSEEYTAPFKRFKLLKFFLLRPTIVPNGLFIKVWEGFRIACAFISCLFFPIYPYIWLDWKNIHALRYILDVMGIIDMYICMHVCYYTPKGLLVSHPLATFKHCITHNFIVNLIVLLPLNLFTYNTEPRMDDGYYKQTIGSYFIYYNKLLAAYRLRSLLEFGETGETKKYERWIRCFVYIMFGFITMNIFSSVLIAITTTIYYTSDGTNYRIVYNEKAWIISKTNIFRSQSVQELHAMALYWVTSIMMNIGFGDIVAVNVPEMIFCIIIVVIGYVLVTYLLVHIASANAGISVYLILYQERLSQLVKFLSREGASNEIRNEMVSHFEYVWKMTRSLETQSTFGKFHVALHEDAVLYLYEPTFCKSNVFQGIDSTFFRQLGVLVYEEYHRNGAKLFRMNDIITCIYFVHRGEIQVTGPDGVFLTSLTQGCIFGNIDNCFSSRVPCNGVATRNSVFLCVNNRKFYNLLKDYPKVRERFEATCLENKFYVSHNVLQAGQDASLKEATSSTQFAGQSTKRRKLTAISYLLYRWGARPLMVSAMISCCVTTYIVAFQEITVTSIALTVACHVIFTLRLFLGFITAYEDESGEVIFDITCIRKRYMTSWSGFWLDLACVLPVHLLSYIAPIEIRAETWTYVGIWYLIRAVHIFQFFNVEHQRLHVSIVTMKILFAIVLCVLFLHMSACLSFMTACFKNECSNLSWAYAFSPAMESRPHCHTRYLCALYMVTTVLTSTGTGDTKPFNVKEVILLTFLMLGGKVLIAIFVGHMSAIVAHYTHAVVNYNYETTLFKIFLKHQKLSPPLFKKVLSYSKHLWTSEYGEQVPHFFKIVPDYLKGAFKNEVYGEHIYKNAVFSVCHPDFLRQVVAHLQRKTFFAGNFIVSKGDVNGTMYFIHRGQVQVLSVDGSTETLTDVLQDGDMFGLIQGLYRRTPHTHTFRALSVSVILVLKYSEWRNLLLFFPQACEDLYERACEYAVRA